MSSVDMCCFHNKPIFFPKKFDANINYLMYSVEITLTPFLFSSYLFTIVFHPMRTKLSLKWNLLNTSKISNNECRYLEKYINCCYREQFYRKYFRNNEFQEFQESANTSSLNLWYADCQWDNFINDIQIWIYSIRSNDMFENIIGFKRNYDLYLMQIVLFRSNQISLFNPFG